MLLFSASGPCGLRLPSSADAYRLVPAVPCWRASPRLHLPLAGCLPALVLAAAWLMTSTRVTVLPAGPPPPWQSTLVPIAQSVSVPLVLGAPSLKSQMDKGADDLRRFMVRRQGGRGARYQACVEDEWRLLPVYLGWAAPSAAGCRCRFHRSKPLKFPRFLPFSPFAACTPARPHKHIHHPAPTHPPSRASLIGGWATQVVGWRRGATPSQTSHTWAWPCCSSTFLASGRGTR